jgi:hypothetical protein
MATIIPWTAVASTGAVDEESIYNRRYEVHESALGYEAGSPDADPVVARYNVTDTSPLSDRPTVPGWTVLELGAFAPPGSSVLAVLVRVEPCTGKATPFARVIISDRDAATCASHQFSPADIDFSQWLYYVEVTIQRQDKALRPEAYTLRVL